MQKFVCFFWFSFSLVFVLLQFKLRLARFHRVTNQYFMIILSGIPGPLDVCIKICPRWRSLSITTTSPGLASSPCYSSFAYFSISHFVTTKDVLFLLILERRGFREWNGCKPVLQAFRSSSPGNFGIAKPGVSDFFVILF